MKHYYQHWLRSASDRQQPRCCTYLWSLWCEEIVKTFEIIPDNFLLGMISNGYINDLISNFSFFEFEKLLTSNSLSWLLTELLSLGLTFLYNDKYFDICHRSGLAIFWIIKGCVLQSVRKSCHTICVNQTTSDTEVTALQWSPHYFSSIFLVIDSYWILQPGQ